MRTSAEPHKRLNKTAESCKHGVPKTGLQVTSPAHLKFQRHLWRSRDAALHGTDRCAGRDYESINSGWRTHYWTKLGEYLRAKKVARVRRFLEEFKNRANIDVVDQTWMPDAVLHVTGSALPPGRDAQKNVGRAIFAAFGDVHVEVNDTIVEGDRVVERHTARAVHKGEFQGIPATGKKVFWTENHIYRIVDGKIAETWSEPSFHGLLAQIRGTKTAGQAGD